MNKENSITKANTFTTLKDPLIESSLNYLSLLTLAKLHNCITLYKQFIGLMSTENNMQDRHIDKKVKTTNCNNCYNITYERTQFQQLLLALSSLSDSSENKS